MHPSLNREIPEFLLDSIVYCDSFTFRKNEKSCFLLAKNLKFYEFRKKQHLHSIDLSESFTELKESIQNYNGRKCKWFGAPDIDDSKSMQEDCSISEKSKKNKIKFGKYIYKNFDISKLYLILKCWHKLIVLQRFDVLTTTTNSLRLVAEYENVVDFKIVPSTLIKFQAIVRIQFSDFNENYINTDFQDNEIDNENKSSNALLNQQLQQKNEFKQLLERVRNTKAELQFHKEITHKQFQCLKNKQTFGSNLLRSSKLDEKPMLGKCGDVWLRISSHDELIVGLPLINNCTPPNLTILKNLQPVIKINQSNNLHCQFRIYQLQQKFENLETLETFFQTEDAYQFDPKSWVAMEEAQILPSSYVILLLKFRLTDLILINGKCQLFVRFQVLKNFDLGETETQTTRSFEQHLFIKTIDFQEVLQQRQAYELKFNEKTMHQDFLALAMVGYGTQIQIDFATYADCKKFENLLVKKFDFEIVQRDEARNEFDDGNDATLELDIEAKEIRKFPCILYYNRKPSSLWFGTLIAHATDCDGIDFVSTSWTFYNKNEDKAFLMFKLIFSDLITHKCNVKDIKYSQQCHNDDIKSVNFENAMRQEISAFLHINKNDNEEVTLIEKTKKLIKLQYNTDILATALC